MAMTWVWTGMVALSLVFGLATGRLDAVASSGFSISRGKAADLISSGKVQLNHQECLKPDRPVSEGDVISCRGFG